MSQISAEVLASLKGRSILIIEDDDDLAGDLTRVFEQTTGVAPGVARWMDAALEQLNGPRGFDLVVTDVMLPESRGDYEEIQSLEEQLKELTATIAAVRLEDAGQSGQSQLRSLRAQRAIMLERIDQLTHGEGGIEVIERWRAATGRPDFPWPMLFLTAVGSGEARSRGAAAAGPACRWLVKPVSTLILLRALADLLSGAPARREA